MKKYLVIRGTRANGQDLPVGEIVDLDDRTARVLLDYGKIAPYEGGEEIIYAEPAEIVNRDPVVKRRGRKPKYGV